MPRPELGSKRLCENCGARFFDFNRSSIVCPKCGTVVERAPRLAQHVSAPRLAQHVAEGEDEEVPAGAETELVSLEEADAEEDKVPAAAEDEVLEEEEEDEGNVGNLIDSDIGDEEER